MTSVRVRRPAKTSIRYPSSMATKLAASMRGVLPLLGGLTMLAPFARSAHDMYDPAYGSTSFHGIGGVFLLGAGSIAAGTLTLLITRTRFQRFLGDGRTTVTELTVTED